jgi:hypothetical protein
MFTFKQYKILREEAKKPKVSSNTKGVLHELLVGYHLREKQHMEKHPDVNGDSPKQAHDKLKSQVSPEEYNAMNKRAKAAAEDIKKRVGSHGTIDRVQWTSKAGDLHRATGTHATQKEDASDIVVTTRNSLNEEKHHGISLKVTDKKSGNLPVSNPGVESTHGGEEVLKQHRKKLLKRHPWISKITNADDRKEYMRSNPSIQKDVREANSKALNDVVEHLHNQIQAMTPKQRADHIRKIIAAKKTPMQTQGHAHIRHTTYGDGSTSATDPSTAHEHMLNDHKNITVSRSGTSIIFSHKGKPFAKHRLKFENADNPTSSIKGSGELIGEH